MSYTLYFGDKSSDLITFDEFKKIIGDEHAGQISLIGGKTEIRDLIDPSSCSAEHQEKLDEFIDKAVRYYMLYFQTIEQLQSTRKKLDKSHLDLIFLRMGGTHGAGDPPDED